MRRQGHFWRMGLGMLVKKREQLSMKTLSASASVLVQRSLTTQLPFEWI